jgi:4-coumarate--CoA ligase
MIITHPVALETALAAAREAGIRSDRVILLNTNDAAGSQPGSVSTIDELVFRGLCREAHFVERTLNPGEAKTKLAFLSFSSGTTGKPKVSYIWLFIQFPLVEEGTQAVAISHYGPIANTIQSVIQWGVGMKPKSDCYAPGDVALCGTSSLIYAIFSTVDQRNSFASIP